MSAAGTIKSYLNQGEAAEFCGYCRNTFRAFAEKYDIPRYGPKKDRYRPEDLDAFMANPEAFHNPIRIRRAGFKPVEV